ncbi:hypothetical protein BOX15_Mlig022690g2 [Macrostomum lignano]|uniref:Uncharacterized protein n=1 Tax=Macrostomum lignano TaxID=282301 RepID=A0A267GN02_9PLAT|nr:hypothetical protein BOX15_Mlig022690g2 [Macrostomum lignano]
MVKPAPNQSQSLVESNASGESERPYTNGSSRAKASRVATRNWPSKAANAASKQSENSSASPASMESSTRTEVDQQQPLALSPLESKSEQLARRRFADSLRRLVNSAGGASNFLNLLLTEKIEPSGASTDQSSIGLGDRREAIEEANEASPVEALQRCSTILSRMPEAQRALRQLYSQAAADCIALSASAPSLQVEADHVVWLQFRRVLESNATVNLGVRDFVSSVRSGECVLFHRDTDEDTIVESLFPDYKYLIVSRGAEQTALMLPELFEVRSKTSERINHFHKTAGSDDCKVVEVDAPKVEVRKELRDLEARKLHIVTKDLIDELYEFYRQEMLSGVRATTGTAHVPNYDDSQE